MSTPTGQIPQSFIDDVLARVDLAELVGRSVTLKRQGANLSGLCPFHGEKTPSFTVSPTKQFYHCFGCGAHGNALRFLMEHNGLPFMDALRDLAAQAGLQLPKTQRLDPAEKARQDAARDRRRSLSEVLERANAHYQATLRAESRAIDYLKGRGLDGHIARDFQLGYAPPGRRGLASVFPAYDAAELVDSGLVVEDGAAHGPTDGAADAGADGSGATATPAATPTATPTSAPTAAAGRKDRFRDRIMFPIRNAEGVLIGFGGRVLDRGEPKYLNSPETALFSKRHELYGLYEARQAIRKRGLVLVVEGYMDVVALAQAGLRHVVATLGTACTEDHLRKLLRHTDCIVFSFDGDAAGRRAAAKALATALPLVQDLRRFLFLFLPAEHDPDSYVRAHGAAAFDALTERAMVLSAFLIEQASEGCDLATPEGRTRFLAQARPLWRSLPAGQYAQQLLAELARHAQTDVEALASAWQTPERGTPAERSEGAAERAPHEAPSDGPGARAAFRRRTPAPAARAHAAAPRRPPRAIRSPEDNLACWLATRAAWWHDLSDAHHQQLAALPGWHGQALRWLEQQLTEHGASEWPELREHIRAEPWGAQLQQLVDGSELLLPPERADFVDAVARMLQACALRETQRLLGRA